MRRIRYRRISHGCAYYPTLDQATLGLRKFMLMAAAPNVGKTALGVQFGVDVVARNEEACFLFLSLEMERWEIITRIKCCLARMDWKTLVFGSGDGAGRGRGRETYYDADAFGRLAAAEAQLADLGRRIRILDERNFPDPTVETVLEQVADLKAQTGATRAFVLVDYLQVWPIPEQEDRRLRSDLDADKWRIGAMKALRAELEEDAILAISEARKPSGDGREQWGSEMADIMGSARGSYTPDMVFVFRPYNDIELGELFQWGGTPSPEQKRQAREQMREVGMAASKLIIAKGRDGVLREEIDLAFWYRQSRFEEGVKPAWAFCP